MKKEVEFNKSECVRCKACVNACPSLALKIDYQKGLTWNSDSCLRCKSWETTERNLTRGV